MDTFYFSSARKGFTLVFSLEPGEYWWGGTIDVGTLAPYRHTEFTRDLADPGKLPNGQPRGSNQSAPYLISTRGRTLVSNTPFTYSFSSAGAQVDAHVELSQAGSTLADAYYRVMKDHFPPSGSHPALELLSGPQYNTWIEMPFYPTQEKVMEYVDSILEAGLPAGTLFIDDNWAPDYGDWIFDTRRFPDPEGMLRDLHARGFHVVLWLVPFVSPDSEQFRSLEKSGLLLRDRDGNTAIRRWWNGFSAILDITNPQAQTWLRKKLDALQAIGVDGFKYDAGDIGFYQPGDLSYAQATPVEHSQTWAEFGTHTPFNEYRACWKMGGQPLGQRLHDKPAEWGAFGIESLVPEVLGQAMIGHYYTCPDMIGGGEVNSCSSQSQVDQEFVVRYAQVAALMPMMQFSMNPARILDSQHLQMVRDLLQLRAKFTPLILDLAKAAAQTGVPIVRPMSFHCSDPQAAGINDQFFLGEDVVVAPQVKQGATTREVFLPHGTWLSDREEMIQVEEDGQCFDVPTPLDRLPHFTRQR